MAIKTEGLGNALKAIIKNRSERIFTSYKEEYLERLNDLGKAWQIEVRNLLGIQHKGMLKNETPWPKRRTGGLQRSIKKPKAIISRETHRGIYYEAIMEFTPLFKKYVGSSSAKGWERKKGEKRPFPANGRDIGDMLSTWDGKTFSGWKNRAAALFNFAIEKASYQRQPYKGRHRKTVTKDFFTRNMIKAVEDTTYHTSG